MIHPHTKLDFVSDSVGYGVFATQFIPKGTIVYVKDDLEIVISPDDVINADEKYKKIIDTYSYRDENGNYILSWDIAKYVNHCCEGNTISTGYGFEIAIKDIQIGEQITDEYGLLNIESPISLQCDNCNCRGIVSNEDYKALLPLWESKAQEAIKLINTVDQLLWEFLDEKSAAELAILNTNGKLRSLENTIYEQIRVHVS